MRRAVRWQLIHWLLAGIALAIVAMAGREGPLAAAPREQGALVPTAYLPQVYSTPRCPKTSGVSYSGGEALQYDVDNPVRPAALTCGLTEASGVVGRPCEACG